MRSHLVSLVFSRIVVNLVLKIHAAVRHDFVLFYANINLKAWLLLTIISLAADKREAGAVMTAQLVSLIVCLSNYACLAIVWVQRLATQALITH